ncbi:hypothetical protein TDB9533_00027 [Thalassocella blandensis]|nr:hypothetical protein TDB9533_00027 [Thalassocella blandensis]
MLELRILNGLHQGASLSLDEERIILGSSLEADIEVIDPGIKQRHCAIEYLADRNTWYVQALEGELSIGFESKRANVVEVAADLVIKVGCIHVGFFNAEDPWDLEKYSRPEIMQLGTKRRAIPLGQYKMYFGVFAVAGSLLTYSFADDGSSADEAAAVATPAAQHQPTLDTMSAVAAKEEKESLIDVEAELKHMLRQRGLLKKVHLTGAENQWVISGSLSQDDLDTVSRMIARFKVAYPDVELADTTAPPKSVLPFEIRSVSSGMYAHILTTEGQRIYIGDQVAGFTLKKIEKDKILFSGESDVELLW